MVDFVDTETVLVLTAPSDTVYALAYNAAEEGLEDTIRVTSPIELTFENQERAYGEENPTFTYVTSRPDLLAGTPIGKTEATISSEIGKYIITLDDGDGRYPHHQQSRADHHSGRCGDVVRRHATNVDMARGRSEKRRESRGCLHRTTDMSDRGHTSAPYRTL